MRKLRVGVAGLGRAFALMVPTFVRDERVELVAAADPRAEARARFASEFQARTYRSLENLLDDGSVEVVYIATPQQLHVEQVCLAASKGKHVLVEKPMAITLDECRSMIAAARVAGVHLIVGHSHSFNAPILRAREIIERGDVGRVRMISAFNFTDFLYRPRRPEELVAAQGGGVVFNQAAHQIDVVRLLGGGRVRSVRASTGAWDAARPTEGAYSAFLTFEDGVFATVVYSGYAHFDSDEFSGWIGEMGQRKDPARYGLTRNTLKSVADEVSLKSARNYGGPEYEIPLTDGETQHQHFGTVIVSCEHADLRPLPSGVMVYGDSARKLEELPPPHVPRSEVIDELYHAVVAGHAPLHSGEWAAATLEVCLAILRSAREQKEVSLEIQVALPTH